PQSARRSRGARCGGVSGDRGPGTSGTHPGLRAAVENLDAVREDWLRQIAAASDADALEQLRVSILGRSGQLTALLKTLGGLAPDERKTRGAGLNQLKGVVEEALGAAKQKHDRAALDQRLKEERIDVTLPVKADIEGRVHPISQTIDEL